MYKLFIFIFFIIFCNAKVCSKELIVNEDVYAYEEDNNILVYKEGINTLRIDQSKLLDLNQNKILFNLDSKIYLMDLTNNEKIFIDYGYNGLFWDNHIVYENNGDENYKCKNIISNDIKNCYKLYKFNLDTMEKSYLSIPGNDLFLNDVEENNLIYNSIHLSDLYCNSICSYIGIYNIKTEKYKMLTKYNDININMSGNGFISDDEVIFENYMNLSDCNGTQIFKYSIQSNQLYLLPDADKCFNKELEIIDFNKGYFIFKSKINNYEDNLKYNYIYSVSDLKYIKTNLLNPIAIINQEIIGLNNGVIEYSKIDLQAPYIEIGNVYNYLVGKLDTFKKNIFIEDDLTNREAIKVEVIKEIKLGDTQAEIEACDKFNNCKKELIFVNVIEFDNDKPRIYCEDLIYLSKGEVLLINDYGYAYDNIDGVISLTLESVINYSVKEQTIIISAVDASGNRVYQNITLIIYSNDLLYTYYFIVVVVWIFLVIIIYIFRFKKHI